MTDGLSDCTEPTFDKSGKYLYFFGSTDAGPVRNWFDLSSMDMHMSNVIYLTVLSQDSISPLAKQTLYPNNAKRPVTFTLDLRGHYDIKIGENNKVRAFLSIYNLLDRLNELSVNSSTGRAYTAIVYPINVETFRSNYNDIYDSIENPYMFSRPREIKIGLGYVF